MNQIAGKPQAFYEASQSEFSQYGENVVSASRLMVEVFNKKNIDVITGGTDSHIVLVNTGNSTGHDIANALEKQHGIIVNKNTIPNDKRSVLQTSGIRIGTAAEVTRRGFDVEYFQYIANIIADTILEGV